MSTLSQFAGGMPVTKAIVNAYSTNGWVVANLPLEAMLKTSKVALSGSMTAGTLKTLLSVTGKGVLEAFGVQTKDATSRTIRVKVSVDGVSALDSTSAAIAGNEQGAAPIGNVAYTNYAQNFAPDSVYFNQSLLIEVASSLTETDKLDIAYRYKTF